MLKFKPIGQTLHRTDTFGVVADSVEYLKVEFDFSSSDFGGITTAVFSPFYNKGINYEVVLDDNNSCIVPEEVIKHRGFNISIYSVIGNKKITSDKFSVPVAESGYAKGETPKDPTPTVYEQLLEIVNNTKSIAKSVRDDADSGAFNGTNGTDGVGVSKAEISANGILTITLTDGKVINVGNVKGEKGDPSVIAIDDSTFNMWIMGDAIYCTKKEVTIKSDSDNESTIVVPRGTLIASYKPKPYFGNAYHYLIIIGECTFKDKKYKYGIHRYYNITDEIVSSTSFDDFALKTEIPTKISQLTNDNDFVSDADYTHTDNNFTDTEKSKLDSLVNYDDTELKKQISIKQDKLTDSQFNNIKAVPNKQDKLTAGENIVINNSVISATCVIKPLVLSTDKSSPTMLTDIGAGAFITKNTGYIKTSGGFQKAIGKGAELIIVSTLKDNIAQLCVTVQTGSSVLLFWDKMSADMKNEIFISTLSVKNDLNSLTDKNVMSGTFAKTMFDERIKKSEIGDGLKYENGKLSLDITTATAETLYGGED